MPGAGGLQLPVKVIYATNNRRLTGPTRSHGPARREPKLLYEPGRDQRRGVSICLDRGPIPKGAQVPAFDEYNHYK